MAPRHWLLLGLLLLSSSLAVVMVRDRGRGDRVLQLVAICALRLLPASSPRRSATPARLTRPQADEDAGSAADDGAADAAVDAEPPT